MRRALIVSSLAVLGLAAWSPPAAAQAWLSPGGEGSVTLITQMIDHVRRLGDDGSAHDVAQFANFGLAVEIEYAVTDRWSVSAFLPYIFGRYRGGPPPPFLPYLAVDSCHCLHSSFQDVSATAHYNLVNVDRAFMVTPEVSVSIPTHAYNYVGESVVGTRLKQLGVGIDVGQRLDGIIPGLAVQGGYTFTLVERALDIAHNRSNATVEAGFALTRHLSTHGILSWQRTHGGLRFPQDVEPFPERHPEFHRLLRENYLQFGLGASYAWRLWDVSASYVMTARGTNSHDVNVYSVTVGRSFALGR